MYEKDMEERIKDSICSNRALLEVLLFVIIALQVLTIGMVVIL